MARQLRLEHAGALWHITSRGNERKKIFRDDVDREKFLGYLAESVKVFGWILHVYVLMGTHYHLLLETPECTLSQGMHWLNGCYAQWFNRKHRRVGHLFQGRFKGILVEKESHLLELARYVVLNPVRAKMVEKPEDWRWSSYRATAGFEAAPPFLTTDWILGQFGATKKEAQGTYRHFVDEGISLKGRPWKKLVGQIYLGSAEWVESMQTLIESTPRSDEIPKTQRMPMRPEIDDVLDAVTSHFSTSRTELKSRNGGRVRRLVAHIAWREGLIRQQKIAEHLGVGSYTTVSAMIKCCRSDLESDASFHAEADRCLASIKRRPPPGTGLIHPPTKRQDVFSRRAQQR